MSADDTARRTAMKLNARFVRLIDWRDTMEDGGGEQRRRRRSGARGALRLAAWWCAGAAVAAVIAISLALFQQPAFEQTAQGHAVIGDDSYLVTIESARGAMRITQESERGLGWS